MPDEQKPTDFPEPPEPPESGTPQTVETAPTPLEETKEEGISPESAAEEAAKASFKTTMDSFWKKHLKGERLPEEDEKTDVTRAQTAKLVGTSLFGAAASIVGFKLLADLPRWVVQKYYTTEEQKRLSAAFEAGEKSVEEEGKEGTSDVVKEKAVALEKAIDDSKYLSAAQKEKLKEDMRGVQDRYDEDLTMTRKKRGEAVAKLLDETIQTRVKGVTVVKETVNSVLALSSLSALRGAGYGAVALYERYQKVSKEKKEGKRTESLAKELVVNGFKETWNKLAWKGEGSKKEKAIAFAAAAGTVLRFVGIGGLASTEIMNEGVSEAIGKTLSAWEQKSAGEFVADNFEENIHRVTGGLFRGAVETPAPEAPEAEGPDVEPDHGSSRGEVEAQVQDGVSGKAEAPDAGYVEAPAPDAGPQTRGEVPVSREVSPAEPAELQAREAVPEQGVVPEKVEAPEGKSGDIQEQTVLKEALKSGIVEKGDGATQAALRGLGKDELKHFGLENATPKRLAAFMRDAMKNAGMSSEDHLTHKAIGHVSFRVEEISGKPMLVGYDLQTLKQIPRAELFSQRLMEHIEPSPIEPVPEPEVPPTEPAEFQKEIMSDFLKRRPEYQTPQEEMVLEKTLRGMEKGKYDKSELFNAAAAPESAVPESAVPESAVPESAVPESVALAEAPAVEVPADTSKFTLANAVMREGVSSERVEEVNKELARVKRVYQEVTRAMRENVPDTREEIQKVASAMRDAQSKYGAFLKEGWQKDFMDRISEPAPSAPEVEVVSSPLPRGDGGGSAEAPAAVPTPSSAQEVSASAVEAIVPEPAPIPVAPRVEPAPTSPHIEAAPASEAPARASDLAQRTEGSFAEQGKVADAYANLAETGKPFAIRVRDLREMVNEGGRSTPISMNGTTFFEKNGGFMFRLDGLKGKEFPLNENTIHAIDARYSLLKAFGDAAHNNPDDLNVAIEQYQHSLKEALGIDVKKILEETQDAKVEKSELGELIPVSELIPQNKTATESQRNIIVWLVGKLKLNDEELTRLASQPVISGSNFEVRPGLKVLQNYDWVRAARLLLMKKGKW